MTTALASCHFSLVSWHYFSIFLFPLLQSEAQTCLHWKDIIISLFGTAQQVSHNSEPVKSMYRLIDWQFLFHLPLFSEVSLRAKLSFAGTPWPHSHSAAQCYHSRICWPLSGSTGAAGVKGIVQRHLMVVFHLDSFCHPVIELATFRFWWSSFF